MRHELQDSAAAMTCCRDCLDLRVPSRGPRVVGADELAQLSVPADHAGAWVVDDHFTGPNRLAYLGVPRVECAQVLHGGISETRRARLPARQLHRVREVREPWHPDP